MPKLTQSQQLVYRVALVMDYSLEYLGGAQSAFLDEAEALSTYGHDVLIVAPGTVDSRWTKQWDRHLLAVKARGTIPVVDLPYIPNNDKLQKKLREIFNQEIIDIVHVHSEFGLAHAAAAAAHDLEIPIVHTVHTFFGKHDFPNSSTMPLLHRCDRHSPHSPAAHPAKCTWPKNRSIACSVAPRSQWPRQLTKSFHLRAHRPKLYEQPESTQCV